MRRPPHALQRNAYMSHVAKILKHRCPNRDFGSVQNPREMRWSDGVYRYTHRGNFGRRLILRLKARNRGCYLFLYFLDRIVFTHRVLLTPDAVPCSDKLIIILRWLSTPNFYPNFSPPVLFFREMHRGILHAAKAIIEQLPNVVVGACFTVRGEFITYFEVQPLLSSNFKRSVARLFFGRSIMYHSGRNVSGEQ